MFTLLYGNTWLTWTFMWSLDFFKKYEKETEEGVERP